MKTIKWRSTDNRLDEAVTSGLEIAFVSPDGKQAHQFCHCRDFLHDAVRSAVIGAPCDIYSFHYNPKSNPKIGVDKVRLIVGNSEDHKLREKIPACLDLIHQFEDKLGIKNTVVQECEAPPRKYRLGGVWYFKGHRRWIVSPVVLSVYTLLIRTGMGHRIGDSIEKFFSRITVDEKTSYCAADFGNVSAGLDGIKRILKEGDRTIFSRSTRKNYPRKIEIEDFHEYFGIVGFTRGDADPKLHVVEEEEYEW